MLLSKLSPIDTIRYFSFRRRFSSRNSLSCAETSGIDLERRHFAIKHYVSLLPQLTVNTDIKHEYNTAVNGHGLLDVALGLHRKEN